MKRPLVFVFPGQSSRDAAMFERIDRIAPGLGTRARRQAEAAAGQPFDGRFASNLQVQTAVFAATLAYLSLLQDAGWVADASAGLSLGEYAHLVDIGALGADAALSLVSARGRCYDAGPEGAMAALFPLGLEDAETLCQDVCAELDDPEAVAVANINSPQQVVVAGRGDAVDRVLALSTDRHYVQGQLIERRIPMHVARFRPVAGALRGPLADAPWQSPTREYWPNVEAAPQPAAQGQRIVDCLCRHVYQPVRWRETVESLASRHPSPVFVEVGPAQVLTRLMGRRWLPHPVFAVDLMDAASPQAWRNHLEVIRDASGH